MPLVSVIVPVFNSKNFLAEALDSVLAQTYENLEVVLIDDGSTDGSGEICDRYAAKDKRFRVYHQANQGVSATRNAGLDLATGDFLAFLDSDDAYEPEAIAAMMDAMAREKVDVVMCKYTEHKTPEKMSLGSRDKALPVIVGGGNKNCGCPSLLA